MQATVQLSEEVLRQLDMLAQREGGTPGDLIRRIVDEHMAGSQPFVECGVDVSLPLIPSETGPIRPVTGRDVDELVSDDHFAA